MSSDTWNLTPDEWSNVLQSRDGSEAKKLAEELKTKGYKLPWVRVVLDHAEDCSKVLDMGSGRGELGATLGMEGKDITLMDWSQDNLDFSKELFHNLGLKGRFQQVDMTKALPFKDGEFDLVYSCGVFEYFTDEQIRGILKEAFRIAKKRVIILVPNAWSLPYRFGKWYLEQKKQWVWGGEHPFPTLKPHFGTATRGVIKEFSVGTKHSLDFLSMRGGKLMRRVIETVFCLKDHSKPSLLNQGYLLITIGEKA